MYDLAIDPVLDKILAKLAKKDRKQLSIITKKAKEICENPRHIYKFLRPPLQRYNRVHIDSHFVLIFRINHEEQKVTLHEYGHHDEAYNWRPYID